MWPMHRRRGNTESAGFQPGLDGFLETWTVEINEPMCGIPTPWGRIQMMLSGPFLKTLKIPINVKRTKEGTSKCQKLEFPGGSVG